MKIKSKTELILIGTNNTAFLSNQRSLCQLNLRNHPKSELINLSFDSDAGRGSNASRINPVYAGGRCRLSVCVTKPKLLT